MGAQDRAVEWQRLLAAARDTIGQRDAAANWAWLLVQEPVPDGPGGLFADLALEQPTPGRTVAFWGLLHDGDALLANRWPPTANGPLPVGTAFRVIYLTQPAAVKAADIADPRIAVCIPVEPSEQDLAAAAGCLACDMLAAGVSGPQSQEALIRERLPEARAQAQRELRRRQAALYARGTIHTRQGLPIRPEDVFGDPDEAPREAALVAP
jgi:hypothetical protein